MTFDEFQSHFDGGDPLVFASYYLPSLLVAIVILISGAILFMKRDSTRKYILPLIISIICCWGIYFLSKASLYMTLALLGSEDAGAAEFAYQKSFNVNLHQAINLAVSNPGWEVEETSGQNVRFYAACRIADILASSNQDFRNTILEEVQSAPIVTPGFIGTNAINCAFYVDDREQPQLQVAEIIQRCLSDLENSRSNKNIAVGAR
jgi:hypothetical protein